MKSIKDNASEIKRGDIIIISSPSGVGKTTVTKNLLKKIRNSKLSISCTTRKPRSTEKNGKDYFFLNKKKFLILKKKNKFLETEIVFDNYYGTLKKQVFTKKKKTVFLDVDWKGARKLRKKLNNSCFSIFLLPPSIKILKQRLINRHPENRNLALKRFLYAKKDLKYWTEYDYVVINSNLKKCVKEIHRKILDIKKSDLEKDNIKKNVQRLLKS